MTQLPSLRLRINLNEVSASHAVHLMWGAAPGLPWWLIEPLRHALSSPWCGSDQVLQIADALREAAADCPPGSNIAASLTTAAAIVADLAPERAP